MSEDTGGRRRDLLFAASIISPSSSRNSRTRAALVSPSPSSHESSDANHGDAANNTESPISMSDVVELNVGGCKFTASRATLCRVRGSHLESMFSGRHAIPHSPASDGSIFIDRDGSHFRHILNFLRSGCVATLPGTDVEKEELALEADFYGLNNLVKAIRMPKVDIAESLPEETRLQWEQESMLRCAFCNEQMKPSDCPFQGLIPLFCPDNGFKSLPLTFDPSSPNRNNKSYLFIDNIRKNPEPKEGEPLLPVTVKTLEEFRTNFNREWPNVLHRLDEVLLQEPVVVAGGAVLRALTESKGVTRTGDWWHGESDIDLFLYCRDCEEANRIARRIFYALAVDHEKWVVIRCRGVINIHHMLNNAETKVQIVLRLYESPTEVLIGFDVDCCCCAFDGRDVWLAPRCVSALQSGVNVLNPIHAWPNRASYELRLAKYAGRGYAVSVPGIDTRRIDYNWIHQSNLVDLKGLARLVKVASEMDSAPAHKRYVWQRQQQRVETIERPRVAREVVNLRQETWNIESPDEHLINLRGLHLMNNRYDTATDVIVPSVYPEPQYVNWAFDSGFPLSRTSRDQAWVEILDAGENENRPAALERRLVDAWDTAKRSREYLNGGMDPYDLSSIYYSHAYKDNTDGQL